MIYLYRQGAQVFQAGTVDELARTVSANNVELNKSTKASPYPEDYNLIYNKIAKAQQKGQVGMPKMSPQQQAPLTRSTKTKKLTFKKLINGTRAILDVNMLGHYTSQAEMVRRAGICSTCPLAVEGIDCASCKWGALIGQFMKKLKSAFGNTVKVPGVKGRTASKIGCDHCGCSMFNMIPASIKAFREDEEDNKERPSHCWVRRDSGSYNPAD